MTWRERIVVARERGQFTREDIELASEWDTCAVGELGIVIHKIPNLLLAIDFVTDGSAFVGAVTRHEFDEAERLLDNIADLALCLKREASHER